MKKINLIKEEIKKDYLDINNKNGSWVIKTHD